MIEGGAGYSPVLISFFGNAGATVILKMRNIRIM